MTNQASLHLRGTHHATQSVYDEDIVNTTKELFGDRSVEYGLAVSGSHALVSHLSRYEYKFDAYDLLSVANNDQEHTGRIQLVKHALRSARIGELREKVTKATEGKDIPPWFD